MDIKLLTLKKIKKPEFQQKLRTQVDDEADGEGQLEDNPLPTDRIQNAISGKEISRNLKKKNMAKGCYLLFKTNL